jgi:glucose/arabinose dehydrogenase
MLARELNRGPIPARQEAFIRNRSHSVFALVVLGACLPACQTRSADAIAGARNVALAGVVHGLDHPVYLTAPAGDPRLFVVEQPGRIRIVQDGRLLAKPFLDITDRVGFGGERGLLSLAFDPDYAHSGRIYVNYTDRHGDTRIERYRVTSNPGVADPASAQRVLTIDQPYSNHNGGHLLFGPDSLLYVGMGDGGSANDPRGNGQNRNTLLGKILRIDVRRDGAYTIPPGNPFEHGGGRPEIWATGVRNPWRLWIDPAERLLYVADVGQNQWEEVDVAPLERAGLDYGWNVFEASHCLRGTGCDSSGHVTPVLEYGHDAGCSITGGIVYRGRAVPALAGQYLYADYCSGWIRGFRFEGGRASEPRTWFADRVGSISSFGVDGRGEAYVLTLEGGVYRFTAGTRAGH